MVTASNVNLGHADLITHLHSLDKILVLAHSFGGSFDAILYKMSCKNDTATDDGSAACQKCRIETKSRLCTIVSPINKACTNYPEIKVEKKKSVKLGILVEDH